MAGLTTETLPVPAVRPRGMSLRDIVFVLFRRKWLILAIAVPMIVVGSFSLFTRTRAYTAAASVLVELVKVDLPMWNTSGRNIDFDRSLSTLNNIAMSVPVGEIAAEVLQDSIPVIQQLDPKLTKLHQPGALRDFLLTNLDVSVLGESMILQFTFSSENPHLSLMAVRALRDAFVQYQVHGLKSKRAVAYYDEQIDDVRANIDSLLIRRGQVMKKAGYSSLDAEVRYDTGQLTDLEDRLREATSNRLTVQMQYEHLHKMLDGNPLDFPTGTDESKSYSLVSWRTTVAKHQDELDSILALHTDDSVPARRQRDILNRSIENLRREETAYVESLRMELDQARAREALLKEQVATLKTKNMRVPEAYRAVTLIDSEIESVRSVLRDLQVKRGEVRLAEGADERVSSVVSLTAPEIMENLSGGKTLVYFGLLVFFAVALGVAAALIRDNMDHRVYGPADVEDYLKLPVLASVSRTD